MALASAPRFNEDMAFRQAVFLCTDGPWEQDWCSSGREGPVLFPIGIWVPDLRFPA